MTSLREQNGFVAVISVIIITIILLVTITTLSTTGFLNRFNILEGEAKEVSAGLAAACVESARIKIARDPSYSPTNEVLNVDDKTCTIVSVQSNTIKATGSYKGATTNYEVILDGDQSVDSWREVTNF